MGDFNAHSLRWGYKSSNTTGSIVENFINSGPVVDIENADEPTFFAYNGQQTHPEDLVLSHLRLENKSSLKLHQAPGSSGHSILLLEIKTKKLYRKQREPCFPRWNFKKAKWEDYQRQSDVEITEQLLNGNIDHIYKQLKDQKLKCAMKFIPRGKIKKYTPFLTDELEEMKIERAAARRAAKTSDFQKDRITLRQKNSILKRCIRTSKREAYRKFLEERLKRWH
nr:uncharacterized protein LOC112211566 [Halyomorpha halys]